MDGLPPEVLRDILHFTVLLDSRIATIWACTQQSIIVPLRISHVCGTWRDLSLSDGRIWSYLYIDSEAFRRGPRARKNHLRDIFDTWIERSGRAPLNYRVWFNFRSHYPDEDGIKCAVHIVTTLVANHHRWQDVDFSWVWDHGHIGTFDLAGMPMLTSLRLLYKRRPHVAIDFGQSSQLRKVDIRGNVSISASKEPLRELKEPSSLTFRDGYNAVDAVRSCQKFLGSAPYLEELHLDFEEGLPPLTSSLNKVRPVCSGLRLLKLYSTEGADIFMDAVTLPSLRSLAFNCTAFHDGPRFMHFLERSFPPLTHLEIISLRAFMDTFIPCLELLPSLEQLVIRNVSVDARFFRELTVPEGDGTGNIVCPALKALGLYDLKCAGERSEECVEAIIRMLESRAKVMPTFKSVWFNALDAGTPFVETSHLHEYDEEAKRELFMGLRVGVINDPFADID